jgi:prepilin-type processing-associated H-X9-DG protein
MATVDTFVLKTVPQIPKVGAVYVDPDVALDLKGNAFLLDGNDHALDGTVLPGGAVDGIATEIGDPPGANEVNLLSQIDSNNYDQVIGVGGMPSIGETADVPLDSMFELFKSVKTQELAPGTYNSPTFGNLSNLEVTYVNGDLQLTGNGQGAGVLFVDGSVTFTGQFTFHGLIIVRGDARMTGGGAGIHVLGSMMIGESFTAVDPLNPEDLTVSGNADIFYCSEMLDRLSSLLRASYAVVYYNDK